MTVEEKSGLIWNKTIIERTKVQKKVMYRGIKFMEKIIYRTVAIKKAVGVTYNSEK